MLNQVKYIKKIVVVIALTGLICPTAYGMRSIFLNCFSASSMPKPVLPVKFQALTSSLISSLVRIYFFNKKPKPIVALPKYESLYTTPEILSLQLSGDLRSGLFMPLIVAAIILDHDNRKNFEEKRIKTEEKVKVNERTSQEGDVEKLDELHQRIIRMHQLYEKRYGTSLPLTYSGAIGTEGIAHCSWPAIYRPIFPNRVIIENSNECIIEVNDQFFNLPDADKDAIIAHEIGHRILCYDYKNIWRYEWSKFGEIIISRIGISPTLLIPLYYGMYCSRQTEMEADRQAVLAIGSIEGLKSFLSSPDEELEWIDSLFRSHPTHKDRIAALEEIEQKKLLQVAPEQKQQVQEEVQKQYYPQEEVD